MVRKIVKVYILAGGQSHRIGYDKLVSPINNTTLLARTINTCQTIFNSIVIVSKEQKKYSQYGIKILIDNPIADGPLAGIIAALEDCPQENCFIVAADFYDLSIELIKIILDNYHNEDFFGLVINGKHQPLCGVYARTSLLKLKEAALSDNFKISDTLDKLNSRYYPIKLSKWRNINYPSDIESLRREHV